MSWKIVPETEIMGLWPKHEVSEALQRQRAGDISSENALANTAASTKVPKLSSVNKGIKYDSNKPNTALLPPLSLLGASRVLGMGASKYGPDNWRGGIEYRRLLGAALRHILAYQSGEDIDPESGLSHIHHATVNLMFLGEFIELGKTELDDRWKP